MKIRPSIERLREVFSVEADGALRWKIKTCRKVVAGAIAGSLTAKGYVCVRLDGCLILSHRVVFAITRGRWPSGELDHANIIRFDNRPCNLREASRTENNHNKTKNKNNTSGFKGASWNKAKHKWDAEIGAHGKRIKLGRFNTAEAAGEAYAAAALLHHGAYARII